MVRSSGIYSRCGCLWPDYDVVRADDFIVPLVPFAADITRCCRPLCAILSISSITDNAVGSPLWIPPAFCSSPTRMLDIFADTARFGEGRGIGNCEGHLQQRQRLR